MVLLSYLLIFLLRAALLVSGTSLRAASRMVETRLTLTRLFLCLCGMFLPGNRNGIMVLLPGSRVKWLLLGFTYNGVVVLDIDFFSLKAALFSLRPV